MGYGFSAVNLNGKLILWGGEQLQPCGRFCCLPTNIVYSFTPIGESGRWKVMPVTGAVHPGRRLATFSVVGSQIFLFGGDDILTNALSTLSADGHFKRLSPRGEIPSPRRNHRGFVHNGTVYFLCGVVGEVDKSRKEDFADKGHGDGFFYTNELIEYDPIQNRFSHPRVRGARLSPRSAPAIAVLSHRAFIHGGKNKGANRGEISDFYVLDMTSLQLTEIKATGYTKGIWCHIAVPISKRHILFAGGAIPNPQSQILNRFTNQVKIFDTEKEEWEEEEPLSSVSGTGLADHRAVEFPKANGVSILCIGGLEDSRRRHPSHMVVFDVIHE